MAGPRTKIKKPKGSDPSEFGAHIEDNPQAASGIGLPPPTEFVPVALLLRDEKQVIEDITAQRRRPGFLLERSLDWSRDVVRRGASAVLDSASNVGRQSRAFVRYVRPKVALLQLRTRAAFDGIGRSAQSRYPGPQARAPSSELVLAATTELRLRASVDSQLLRTIPAGSRIMVHHLEANVPDGWAIATTEQGEVGFLRTR